MGTIQDSSVNIDAMLGCLDDSILFGMEPATEFVALTGRYIQLLPQAADFGTVTNARWGTVVAGSKDILVLDHHRPDLTPQTGRPAGNEPGDIHKVLIPGRAVYRHAT